MAVAAELVDDLLQRFALWTRRASIGDNGEEPYFELTYRRDSWEAFACSFYDGTAMTKAATPEAAMAACLEDLLKAPEKQRESERRSAVMAVAFALRISHQEAERRLSSLEGWTA